jgi:hypothetical protein
VRLRVVESVPTAEDAQRHLHKDASTKPVRGRGRPAVGQRPRLALRASEELHLAIQQWAEQQIDAPNQSEAIRRLLIIALTAERRRAKAERHKDVLASNLSTRADGARRRAADAPDLDDPRSQATLPDAAE